MQSTCWRTRDASGVSQFEFKGLRVRGRGVGHGLCMSRSESEK